MAVQFPIFDVSGAVQAATNWLLKQANEVYSAENLRFDKELGSAERRPGYSLFQTLATNKFPQGFFEAKFPDRTLLMFAYNNAGNTNTVLSCYDPLTNNTSVIKNDYPPNTKLQMVMNAQEMYVAGITTDTGSRQTIINVKSDLSVSTNRNLFGAPKAAFIGENSGVLYAMNVEMSDGKIYPDRAYVSSPQRGAITYVNAAMTNTYAPVDLTLQTPAMSDYSVPSGTAAASSEVNTSNRAWQAFDRTGARWISATYTGWVRYDFGAGQTRVVNYYSIMVPNGDVSNGGGANRSPKSWTFEGSQDGASWTVLDTQTNQSSFSSVTSETRTYKTANTTGYRYYRLNISAAQNTSEYVAVGELGLYSSVQTTQEMQVRVDSARYIKPGLVMDVYKAGTDQFMYTITPTSVDKAKDTFNFLPYQLSVQSVSTANDTITISDTTNFPTGTPIVFSSTGSVPTPLVAGTTYYAINASSTTLQLANTAADAKIGAKIDITGVGSGNILAAISYVMAKTDEFWLRSRKNDVVPSILWNTDYRSPQTADFIFIASGKVADTAITGWAKSNNRLNIFTKTSMWQYDNANFIPVFEDIGCISHDTICNNATWIIWLDATGKVRARDSGSGQDQIISRAIKNRYLAALPAVNLQGASAVMYDSNYKLDIGVIDGRNIRIVYNFDMNNWWVEVHKRRHVYGLNSNISGTRKSYFLDENGYLFLDEDGDLDHQDTIPWVLRYGRRNYGNTLIKSLLGVYVHQESASSAMVEVKIPGDKEAWQKVGQLTDPTTTLAIPATNNIEARDFDFRISGNGKGKAARIDGMEIWYDAKQSNFSN